MGTQHYGRIYSVTKYTDGWVVIVGDGNNGSTITQRVRNIELFTHNGGSVNLETLTPQPGLGAPAIGENPWGHSIIIDL